MRADSNRIKAIILAPGFALQSQLIEVTENEAFLTISLVEGSGNLGIVASENSKPGVMTYVIQEGTVLSFQLMDEWARGHGLLNTDETYYEVPNVLPGFYKICRHDPSRVSQAIQKGETWREALNACKEGYLESGQTLRLTVGSSKSSSR